MTSVLNPIKVTDTLGTPDSVNSNSYMGSSNPNNSDNGVTNNNQPSLPNHPPMIPSISIPKPMMTDNLDIAESLSYPEDLCPPDNFNMVSTWIYRSSFPKKKNFSFLKKLGLKSIL
ncbi:hypothetical protein BX616_004896 [Lobosporangium transversale]|nr:hypothetical protein BX616_004896 [Lobosporangium transversale]